MIPRSLIPAPMPDGQGLWRPNFQAGLWKPFVSGVFALAFGFGIAHPLASAAPTKPSAPAPSSPASPNGSTDQPGQTPAGTDAVEADAPSDTGEQASAPAPLEDLSAAETEYAILGADDIDRYRAIFALQDEGRWKAANAEIDRVENPVLMGYVDFQRYMHPTDYRSKYGELARWMQRYADHPQARRIYALAKRRRPKSAAPPRAPERQRWRYAARERTAFEVHNPPRSRRQRRRARAVEQHVRSLLRRERPTQSLNYLRGKDVRRRLTSVEYDRIRSWIARSYFMEQVDKKSLALALDVAEANRAAVPQADWIAGLAAWRLGQIDKAAEHFSAMAKADHVPDWDRSAAAYWAARAALAIRRPEDVVPMLRLAAEHPLSFYGLLARRQLGLPLLADWGVETLDAKTLERLKGDRAVTRAIALAQLGMAAEADRELAFVHGRMDPSQDADLLALARQLRLPHMELKIAISSDQPGLEAGLYPIPPYEPEGGYRLDRALLYAIMRKESKFIPNATSRAGARGLMQIMPATAHFITGERTFRQKRNKALYNPALNLRLGQTYADRLMGEVEPEGNLLMLMTAYNAGPGNLRRWLRSVQFDEDPLLFIESIPVIETRTYVERVMASFWIYRARLGQETPSLDALAEGAWPVYQGLDPKEATGSDQIALVSARRR